MHKHTHFVKKTAARLGYSFCGIARAHKLDEDAARLEKWLQKDMQGTMQYMEKKIDLQQQASPEGQQR